jgi:hypothetical protein
VTVAEEVGSSLGVVSDGIAMADLVSRHLAAALLWDDGPAGVNRVDQVIGEVVKQAVGQTVGQVVG